MPQNMRDFLNRIKNSKSDNPRGISMINTPDSYTWTFRGHDYNIGNFLNTELIYYVQSITLPEIAVDSGGSAGTEIQNTTVPSMRMAASQTFQMEILETKKPIIEEYFLKWMMEAREPEFHDGGFAYTYANIDIKFREKSLTYMLFGCRPTSCETINPSQRDTSIIRKVTFNVDFIYTELTNGSSLNSSSSSQTTPVASSDEAEAYMNSTNKGSWQGDQFTVPSRGNG